MVIAIGVCVAGMTGCNAAAVAPQAPAANEPAENAAEETKEWKGTFSTDNFEITVPDELKDIVDVEVSSDRIDIYHKESKDAGFGGLEFSIWAVPTPSEYAGGPYIKIGELNGASTFDMVKGEATEIQWDYNLPDMPADFQKIYDAKDTILASIKGINGNTYNEGAGMKGEDLYRDVLEKYVRAVHEKWDANKLEEEDMSPEFFYIGSETANGLDNIGIAYRDVNCDGIDELFVGDMADDEGKIIYDVYTMVDRKSAHVVTGTARDRYYDHEDSFLCNEWSAGAGSSGCDLYALMNNSTELVYQYGYKYDEYENEEKPWFKSYDKETYESITEEEFNESFAMADNYVKLEYKPLSAYANGAGNGEQKETTDSLPAYEYPGPELFYYVLYDYLIKEYGPSYPDADVTIPCPVIIAEDESNKDDIRVWGDFWVFKYDLKGDTLENTSGGSYPGCIHVKSTDEGYEVTGMDVVGDGSDFEPTAKKIFGKYYDDFIKKNSDTQVRENLRAQIIADYVGENDLKITAYQDYGWDPVPLPEESTDSLYSQLD